MARGYCGSEALLRDDGGFASIPACGRIVQQAALPQGLEVAQGYCGSEAPLRDEGGFASNAVLLAGSRSGGGITFPIPGQYQCAILEVTAASGLSIVPDVRAAWGFLLGALARGLGRAAWCRSALRESMPKECQRFWPSL